MKYTPIKLLSLVAITLLLSIAFQSCSLFDTNSADNDDADIRNFIDTTTYIPVQTPLYKLTEDAASHNSGVPATVYMIGSIHAGKNPYKFSNIVENAFSESDIVVLETLVYDYDQTDLTTLNALYTVANNNQIGSNQIDANTKTYNTLKGYVDAYSDTPDLYDTYLGQFITAADTALGLQDLARQQANLPLTPKLSTTEPIYANTILSPDIADAGYTQENGVDYYFYQKAKTHNKVTAQLETIEDGFNALFNIDIDEQTLTLIETTKIVNGLMASNELENTIEYYTTNDVDALKTENPITDNNDSVYETLLSKRNSAWVGSLKELIKNRDNGKDVFFVVVGWLHTITYENTARTFHTDSFQKLLDNDGFSLEIVPQEE